MISLSIITLSIYGAIIENIISGAPRQLLLSNIMIAIVLTLLVATRKIWQKNRLFINRLFMAFTFVILPLVWVNSKGVMGAQPVYMAFVVLLISLILDPPWAIFLGISNILIVDLLIFLEYLKILQFQEFTFPSTLLISNLIHYTLVYLMLCGIGIAFKKNYSDFQDQYLRLSIIDDLTQLYNRRYLIKSLGQLVSETRRHGNAFSVLFIDINDFKRVNDLEGHLVGDRVLVALGKLIQGELRQYDIAGRYGGDEFMILLPHTAENDAEHISKRLMDAFQLQAGNLTAQPISLAIGVIVPNKKSVEQIIKDADAAMYKKKVTQ